MHVLSGTATGLQSRTEIEVGGGEHATVSTTHILMFRINGQQVNMHASSPPMIMEGDRVRIAGATKAGALQGLAYRNETTGVTGDAGWTRGLLYVAVGLVGGTFVWVNFSSPFFGLLPKIIGSVFYGFAAYGAWQALRIRAAIAALG